MSRQPVRTLGKGKTVERPQDGQRRGSNAACLVVALDGARPFDAASRHWLTGVDEVAIGRGEGDRVWARQADGGQARLVVRLPDPMVSGRHAALHRSGVGWAIVDEGSTNGTTVNGERVVRPRALASGDVVNLGRTFLVFRDADVAEPPSPLDLAADDGRLGALPEGLRTLSPDLGLELLKLQRIACSRSTVVLLGESGTGKEMMAQAVHAVSGRAGAFVPINCAALPEAIAEGELFGAKRGGFTGAVADREGLVAASSGGTLFLDEIGELPLAIQAKLLRTLQEGEVRPLGATETRQVDLRVVAATNANLPALVMQKKFRPDLWARLNAFSIELPSLVERREDLGLLIASLLRRMMSTGGLPAGAAPTFTAEAAAALFAYDWPLNIRELEKALERATVLSAGGEITLAHLPPEVAAARPGADGDAALRERLVDLLREHRGVVSEVARAMGKHRQQIQRWCHRLAIAPESFRGGRS